MRQEPPLTWVMPEEVSAALVRFWAQTSGSHCTWYRPTPGSVRSEEHRLQPRSPLATAPRPGRSGRGRPHVQQASDSRKRTWDKGGGQSAEPGLSQEESPGETQGRGQEVQDRPGSMATRCGGGPRPALWAARTPTREGSPRPRRPPSCNREPSAQMWSDPFQESRQPGEPGPGEQHLLAAGAPSITMRPRGTLSVPAARGQDSSSRVLLACGPPNPEPLGVPARAQSLQARTARAEQRVLCPALESGPSLRQRTNPRQAPRPVWGGRSGRCRVSHPPWA